MFVYIHVCLCARETEITFYLLLALFYKRTTLHSLQKPQAVCLHSRHHLLKILSVVPIKPEPITLRRLGRARDESLWASHNAAGPVERRRVVERLGEEAEAQATVAARRDHCCRCEVGQIRRREVAFQLWVAVAIVLAIAAEDAMLRRKGEAAGEAKNWR